MVNEQEIRQLIDKLRRGHDIIEDKLAPDAGNYAKATLSFLPGAGTAIFADAVNNIRPVSSTLSSAAEKIGKLLEELKELENSCDQWKGKYNSLFRDHEEYKRNHENAESEKIREQINNTQTVTSLRQQLVSANEKNAELTTKFQDTNNELNKKNEEVKRIEQENVNLRLEHGKEISEKNNQLNEKERILARKDEEIGLLRNQKNLTQEELLIEKLRFEKGNLDLFASREGINLGQINNLSKSHEKLFIARKNQNQIDIDLHEANIAQFKQDFLNQGVDIIDIREICQKSERIAQLDWELNQIQLQQYHSHQEVPTT